MADEILLEIITPEKIAFSGTVDEVTVPGSEGEFGVLHGHAALLSGVDIGPLNFSKEGKKSWYALNTGYAEVTSKKVTILVETAERSDMIDKLRAQRAKENAESKMTKFEKEDLEFMKAKIALMRAITRLAVAEKKF
jgi:F-type H+-transporting ATPase subunit epsilon